MNVSWPMAIVLGLLFGVLAAVGVLREDADSRPGGDRPHSTESPAESPTDDSGDTPPTDDDGSGAEPSRDDSRDDSGDGARGKPEASGTDYVVTLTFDDGPHPTYTPQVLRILRDHDVQAVFCVVGEAVRENPELVRDIVEAGHQLCNHTFDHDNHLADRTDQQIRAQLTRTADAIEAADADADVPFFRQPATYVTDNVAAVARDEGYTPLDWTVDPRDWSTPGADAVLTRVLDRIRPGSVVLLHDGGGDRSGTVAALDQILTALDTAGYDVVLPED